MIKTELTKKNDDMACKEKDKKKWMKKRIFKNKWGKKSKIMTRECM